MLTILVDCLESYLSIPYPILWEDCHHIFCVNKDFQTCITFLRSNKTILVNQLAIYFIVFWLSPGWRLDHFPERNFNPDVAIHGTREIWNLSQMVVSTITLCLWDFSFISILINKVSMSSSNNFSFLFGLSSSSLRCQNSTDQHQKLNHLQEPTTQLF